MPLEILAPRRLDYGNPVNWEAPLNRGLWGWWLVLPQQAGGLRFRDLTGKHPFAFHGLTPPAPDRGWAATTRPGGYGELRSLSADVHWLSTPTPGLVLDNARGWTWAVWVKPGIFTAFHALFSLFTTGGGAPHVATWVHTTADTTYGPVTAGVSAVWTDGGWSSVSHTTDNVVSLNTWAHVVLTYTPTVAQTVRLTIYVNGRDVTDRTDLFVSGNAASFTPTEFWLGADHLASTKWQGALDDCRFLARTLDAREVAQLYRASRLGYPQELRRRAPLHVVPVALRRQSGPFTVPADQLLETATAQPITGSVAGAPPAPAGGGMGRVAPRTLDYGNPVNTEAPLNRGLVAWWLMLPQRHGGSTWWDLVARRPGVLTNLGPSTATRGYGPTRRPGGWGELRGDAWTTANTGVVVPNTSALNFGTGDFTILFWLYVTTLPGGADKSHALLRKTTGAVSAPGWYFNVGTWNGGSATTYQVEWWFTAMTNFGDAICVTPGGSQSTGAWYAMAARRQGTTALLWALGPTGLVSGTVTHASVGLSVTNTDTMRLVTYDASLGNYALPGKVDDLRFYNRRLSDIDVRQWVQASKRRYPQELRWRSPLHLVPLAAARQPVTLPVAVAQVIETDTAQPLLSAKTALLGQVPAVATAQAIAATPLTRLVGQVTQTSTAQAVTVAPLTRLVDQTVSTQTAQAVTWSPLARQVPQALATDTAQEVGGGAIARPPASQAFTAQTTVTVLGSAHSFGTPNLLVQVWDAGTPRRLLRPAGISIHPTTFDVTVTFGQPQSGTVVVSGALVPSGPARPAVQAFSGQTSVTLLGTTHAFGHPALLVQVYDAATPQRQVTPATVTLDPATYDVVVTFAQAQSGRLVVSGQVQPSYAVNQGYTFTNTATVTVPGATHGRSTAFLLTQVYDAATPAQWLVPDSVTTHPTTYDVVVTFAQPQSGRLVLHGAAPGTTASLASLNTVEASQALSAVRILALGQPQDTGTAQTSTLVSVKLVGQVSDAVTASPVTWQPQTRLVTAPLSTEASQAVAVVAAHLLFPVVATDTAQGITGGAAVRAPFSQAFTAQTTVTVLGTSHGFGTADLLIQVSDAGTPAASILPESITVHPSTFDVTVTLLDTQSGTILIGGALVPSGPGAPVVHSFGTTITTTLPGVTHGFGHPYVLVQVYDASTPRRQVLPESVTIHPTTFDVTATFVEAMAGTLVASGFVQPSYAPNIGTSFTNVTTVTVPGATHGRATPNLLVQVYDASTPRRQFLPAECTIDPTTYDVVATFLDAQSGRLVLHGALPDQRVTLTSVQETLTSQAISLGRTLAVGQPQETLTSQLLTEQTAFVPNYAKGFTATTSVTILGTEHGYGTANLLVQVYDASVPRAMLVGYNRLTVDPTTSDVTVTFRQPQSGTVVVVGATVPSGMNGHLATSFLASTLVTIPGAQHGFGHPNLLIQVQDAGTPPTSVTPDRITVDPTTFDVQLTFRQPQSGTVFLAGVTARPPTPLPGITVTAQTSVTVPNATHGFNTWHLLAQVYDTATPRSMVEPASIQRDPTTSAITVAFRQPQSGTLVLSGATQGARIGSALVTETGTAQALDHARDIALSQVTVTSTAQAIVAQRGTQDQYAQDFAAATSVTILGTAHGYGHPNLLVQAYTAGPPRRKILPEALTIHPTTYDVTVTFLETQSGTIVVNGASASGIQANAIKAFTATTSVTVVQAEHRFATATLQVWVYNASTPAVLIEPESVTIDPVTFAVSVTFLETQSGSVVIMGAANLGVRANYGYAFSNATTVTILNTDHQFGTERLGIHAYDTSTPRRELLPDSVSVHPTTYTALVTFLEPQSGTIVVNGSSQGIAQSVGQVTVTETAQGSTPVHMGQVGQVLLTTTAQAVQLVLQRLVTAPTLTSTSQPVAWTPLVRLADQVRDTATALETVPPPHFLVGSTLSPEEVFGVTWSPQIRMLAQAVSTQTSRPLGAEQFRMVLQPLMTDTAQVVAWTPQVRLLLAVLDTATPQPVLWPLGRLLQQVTSTLIAQPLGGQGLQLIGQAFQTDLAIGLAVNPRARLVAQSTTTQTAQAVLWTPQSRFVSQLQETTTGQPVAWTPLVRLVGQVLATATAQGLALPGSRLLAEALTSEAGQPVVWAPKIRLLAQPLATDVPQGVTVPLIRLAAQLLSLETGQGVLWSPLERFVALSQSIATSQPIVWAPQIRLLVQPLATDLPQGLTVPLIRFAAQLLSPETGEPITWSPVHRLVALSQSIATSQPVAAHPLTRLLVGTLLTETSQDILATVRRLVGQVVLTSTVQAITWNPRTRLVAPPAESATSTGLLVSPNLLVGQPVATDTAVVIFAPSPDKFSLLEQDVAVDTAAAVTWSPQIRQVFPTLLIVTAHGLTWVPSRLIAPALSTSTAQLITYPQTRLLAPSLATDTGQAILWQPVMRLAGLASELTTSQGVTWSPQIRILGAVTVTSTAHPVAWQPMARHITPLLETLTAHGVMWSPQVRIVSGSLDTGLSQPITWSPKERLLAVLVGTDTSQPVLRLPRGFVDQAVSTQTAQTITWSPLARLVIPVTDTALAIFITPPPSTPVLQGVSAELAQAVAWSPKIRVVTQASSTGSAQVLTWEPTYLLLGPNETGTSQAATVSPLARLVALVQETATAIVMGGSRVTVVDGPVETTDALTLTTVYVHLFDGIAEQDAIFAVTWTPRARLVAQVVETDAIQAVTTRAGIRFLGIFGHWELVPVIQGSWRMEPVIGGHWTLASVETLAGVG